MNAPNHHQETSLTDLELAKKAADAALRAADGDLAAEAESRHSFAILRERKGVRW